MTKMRIRSLRRFGLIGLLTAMLLSIASCQTLKISINTPTPAGRTIDDIDSMLAALGEGVTLNLPEGWESYIPAVGDLDQALSRISSTDPALAHLLSSQRSLAAGAKTLLLAYDPQSGQGPEGIPLTLSITVQSLPSPLSAREYMDLTLNDLEKRGIMLEPVQLDTAQVAGALVPRLSYRVKPASALGVDRQVSLTQYIIIRDQHAIVFSYTSPPDDIGDPDLQALFQGVIQDHQQGTDLPTLTVPVEETQAEPTQFATLTPTPEQPPTSTPAKTIHSLATPTLSPSGRSRAVERILHTFVDHFGPVLGAAWSPDGGTLITIDGVGEVYFWETGTWRRIEQWDFPGYADGPMFEMALSPDGALLAAGTADEEVGVWEVESGQRLQSLDGYEGWITSVAWSPDGSILVTGDSEGLMIFSDPHTAELLRELNLDNPFDSVNALSWSPDGGMLVWGGVFESVGMMEYGGEYRVLPSKHQDSVYAVAWSPDGSRFATGDTNNLIIVWDAQTQQSLRLFREHNTGIVSIAWSPDGEVIASGDDGGLIFLWDAETGETIRMLEAHDDWVLDLAWSPDGTMLVSGGQDDLAIVWGK